ncbi:MAG: glycosyltransferase family 1 protein [Aggregatilineales bacterium]
MKIGINAHLLSSNLGYRTAGIHGYIYNTLAHLHAAAPDDWEITAMVGGGNQLRFDGITMQQAGFSTERPLRRIVWEQGIQPFSLNTFDLYHAMAFVSPLILNRPSVVTVYDLSFIHHPQVLTTARRLYLRLFTALSCRRAKRVIAISESTAGDLHNSLGLPAEKIDVAACGYDEAQHRPLPEAEIARFRQEKGLPERFWLFLGTLEPRKNLTTLLDAYARLPEDERLPLILAGGKGWLYEAIFERVERYQLQDSVHFMGFVPAEELALWYNSAEVFIMPSVFEGFGLPVLEAMACGTPVIVSDASSLPEVAGSAGLCLPPHDVEAWTDALIKAKNDADWRESARVQGFIEAKRYSWRYTAEATIRSYEQALAMTGDTSA